MPGGHNLATCLTCRKQWVAGDCVPGECPGCVCRRRGHLRVCGLCGRCGVKLPPPTRVVDVRHAPPGSYVYVGRAAGRRFAASPWATPEWVSRFATEDAKRRALAEYRGWLLARPALLARLPELRGRVLGCWCCDWDGVSEPRPLCHAAVLAELADGPLGEGGGAAP